FVSSGRQFFPGLSHPREILDLNGDGFLDVDAGRKGRWFYVPEERAFRHEKTPRFDIPEDVPPAVLASIQEQSQAATNRFFSIIYLTHDIVGYDTLGYSPQPIDLNNDGRNDLVI